MSAAVPPISSDVNSYEQVLPGVLPRWSSTRALLGCLLVGWAASTVAGASFSVADGGMNLLNVILVTVALLGVFTVTSLTRLVSESSMRVTAFRFRVVTGVLALCLIGGSSLWGTTTALMVSKFGWDGWQLPVFGTAAAVVTVLAVTLVVRFGSSLAHPLMGDVNVDGDRPVPSVT